MFSMLALVYKIIRPILVIAILCAALLLSGATHSRVPFILGALLSVAVCPGAVRHTIGRLPGRSRNLDIAFWPGFIDTFLYDLNIEVPGFYDSEHRDALARALIAQGKTIPLRHAPQWLRNRKLRHPKLIRIDDGLLVLHKVNGTTTPFDWALCPDHWTSSHTLTEKQITRAARAARAELDRAPNPRRLTPMARLVAWSMGLGTVAIVIWAVFG